MLTIFILITFFIAISTQNAIAPVEERQLQCQLTEVYNMCPTCEGTCETPYPICAQMTCGLPRCTCRQGLVRHGLVCITYTQCPQLTGFGNPYGGTGGIGSGGIGAGGYGPVGINGVPGGLGGLSGFGGLPLGGIGGYGR